MNVAKSFNANISNSLFLNIGAHEYKSKEQYDAVFSSQVIQHTHTAITHEILSSLVRRTKKNGILIILTTNSQRNKTYYTVQTERSSKLISKSSFDKISVSGEVNFTLFLY